MSWWGIKCFREIFLYKTSQKDRQWYYHLLYRSYVSVWAAATPGRNLNWCLWRSKALWVYLWVPIQHSCFLLTMFKLSHIPTMSLFKCAFRKYPSEDQRKRKKKTKRRTEVKGKGKWDSSQQTDGKEEIPINYCPLTTWYAANSRSAQIAPKSAVLYSLGKYKWQNEGKDKSRDILSQ